MSRTYNTKYEHNQKFNDYEFPQGFITPNGLIIKPGEVIDYDYSFTNNDNANIQNTSVRHPNKKKKTNSLGREFTTTGISGTRYWRNRYGEECNKSSRMHFIKRELTQKRRNRLKNQTKEIIDDALNNG